MNKNNESVKNYIEQKNSGVIEYFEECYEELKKPNYSEFCRKYLDGTTAEGVAFDSIDLERNDLTEYLRNKYKLWVAFK